MLSRFIGGILLIVGTSIGGGMLALPVANAASGFWISSIFLILCWILMTLGALYILEVNLYLPPGKNMISMAAATLGKPGLLIAWLSYLLLLYSLLSAYISGGADVFGNLFHYFNINLNDWQAVLLFTLAFGFIVYTGIRSVDLLNRSLMFLKLGIYCLLIIFISPYIDFSRYHYQYGHIHYIIGSFMILLTSFGFAIIVPNLREYFNDDVKALRRVIIIGSLIPLICYLAWDAVIMGSLPAASLMELINDPHTTSKLAHILTYTVNNSVISGGFHFFTSICMLTAFLGVSLCLMSFLSDGLKLNQSGKQGLGLFLLTFSPPLLLVIYYPGAYIKALSYAGILCVILLLLLPALMSFFGRKFFQPIYAVPGGKISQLTVIICSILLLVSVGL